MENNRHPDPIAIGFLPDRSDGYFRVSLFFKYFSRNKKNGSCGHEPWSGAIYKYHLLSGLINQVLSS